MEVEVHPLEIIRDLVEKLPVMIAPDLAKKQDVNLLQFVMFSAFLIGVLKEKKTPTIKITISVGQIY